MGGVSVANKNIAVAKQILTRSGKSKPCSKPLNVWPMKVARYGKRFRRDRISSEGGTTNVSTNEYARVKGQAGKRNRFENKNTKAPRARLARRLPK